MTRLPTVLVALWALTCAPALAATPEQGYVSAAEPKPNFVDMVVTTPDGDTTVFEGDGDSTTNTQIYEDAAVGTWKVAIWNNALPCPPGRGQYTGRATLEVPQP